MLSSLQTRKMIETYAAGNYGKLSPIVPEIGYGSWIIDKEGNRHLDLMASYATLSFGHCHPRLVRALQNQLDKMPICSRALPNEPFALFCKTLAEFCGFGKDGRVLPAVDGAGAIERAVKVARQWGYKNKKILSQPGKDNEPIILSCYGNFHGRTYAAISMSGNPEYRSGFGPLIPGFARLRFGEADLLETQFKRFGPRVIAVFLEPIQGEGGVIVPPDGYLEDVRRLCTKYGVLMCADEIQTGLGRTGYDLACQYEGVRPDVCVVGKALGGGLVPISAVVTTEKIMSVLDPGSDGSTFGGYPLGCAVAVEAIGVLQEENLSKNARSIGPYFMKGLDDIRSPLIKEVRGRGLMIGVELTDEANAGRIQQALLDKKIIVGVSHGILRFSPPLIITQEEIDWALPRIEQALRSS